MTPFADAIEKGIDIVVPTWNHLNCLKLFAEQLKSSSKYPHRLFVHVNEGKDGTADWVEESDLVHEFTWVSGNDGVCAPVNKLVKLGKAPLIAYFNDDMVPLPGWDVALHRFARVNRIPEMAWLSGTMIEPKGKNPCCIIRDYGSGPNTFRGAKLLADLPKLRKLKRHTGGTTWPPTILMRSVFEKVGGLSEEYFPGFGSDPDLAMKLWLKGCRTFVGVADCLIYHFGSKTTGSMKIPPYRKTFRKKHGMEMDKFIEDTLRRGHTWPE